MCGSGGSKTRLAKAAGAEPAGQVRDEKLHAVVARSRFASEKAQNTSRLGHFWKLRCRKSARSCGPKRVSKPKCTKHTRFGALLEVAHFEVKNAKRHHMLGPLFDGQMPFPVAGARDCAPCQE